MSKGYTAIPQAQPDYGGCNYAQPTGYHGGEQPQYAQPPQYPGYADENQPLHQPVNNSFGTQQQGYQQQPGYNAPQYQQQQQPHVQYGGPQYQEAPQPAFNPSYTPAAPAPSVMQQQSTNVVVVNQQPASQAVVHVSPPRASTYMVLTAVLMVLCFLHGNLPSFVCLVPALICAYQAQEHNRVGEYSQAKSCGQFSLFCNILSVAYFALVFVAAIAVVAVAITIGFGASYDPN